MSKYTYYRVIQCDYGQGFEDSDFHEADSQGNTKDRASFKYNLEAYRINAGCPVRHIFRRELNQ